MTLYKSQKLFCNFSALFKICLLFSCALTASSSFGAVEGLSNIKEIKKIVEEVTRARQEELKKKKVNTLSIGEASSQANLARHYTAIDERPYFDLPVTYNAKVKYWIKRFQGSGKGWYKTWLERSSRYLPKMKALLSKKGLPQDLAYVAMIESGFSPHAVSHAQAVGYWQFIKPTASRYGLSMNWWLDERRDYMKSTNAAASYLADLYRMFNSWYLTAAAYNMGEGRTRRLINKHKSDNFWVLSKKRDFPSETRNYIPKLLAAMLIAKAPKLYGFNELKPHEPYNYEYFTVPGGTHLNQMAQSLGINSTMLKRMNAELIQGYIPDSVKAHRIRIPSGLTQRVAQYVRAKFVDSPSLP